MAETKSKYELLRQYLEEVQPKLDLLLDLLNRLEAEERDKRGDADAR